VNIQFLEPKTEQEWDNYVLQLENYSFLLSSARFSYLKDSSVDVFRYLVFDNDRFVGVSTGFVDKVKVFGKYLECKHNPILISNLSKEEKGEILNKIFEKLISLAKENRCFFIRISPLVKESEIYEKVYEKFKSKKSPVHPQDSLISQYFDISKSEEDLRHDMSSSTRNNINKLVKNEEVKVKVFTDMTPFPIFEKFYKETKKFKGYTGKSGQSLKKEFEYQEKRGMLYFTVGYYKDQPIAVWQNTKFGKYMHVYQAGSDVKFRQKNVRITYLLFWETVKLCKEKGVETLDLFGGMLPEGIEKKDRNPWKGVNDFKMSLGGKKVTYMHPRDIPLKPYYSIYLPYANFRVQFKGHTTNW
jgi:lipid II:glycine glycyltransferase (peptidoglycan interpeptide bridge formation enzyme)